MMNQIAPGENFLTRGFNFAEQLTYWLIARDERHLSGAGLPPNVT
jgi:hypothetical protein